MRHAVPLYAASLFAALILSALFAAPPARAQGVDGEICAAGATAAASLE
jgi:hypothetical protein